MIIAFHIKIGQFLAKLGYLKILFPPFLLILEVLNFNMGQMHFQEIQKGGRDFD